ncbi:MAG: efflux transporter outer membrane subunit [Candidatus Acidiferrales bacterium]
MISIIRKLFVPCLAALALLDGCTVGPNFKKPAAPDVARYTPAPVVATSSIAGVPADDSQRFLDGQDIPGEWWTVFRSQPLNDLIARSLKANPDIKAAQAALVVANENVLAQRGAYYPSVTGGFSALRAKSSTNVSPVTNTSALNYSFYTPEVSVSYVPDVFGMNRRTIESLKAQDQQARFTLAATLITLSSNVVGAAIQEASLRAQIAATHDLISINTDILNILRTQLERGYVSRLDVAAQESQLAQIVATLPPLEKALAQQRDLLAALSGGYPSNDPPETFELASLTLPADLPLSLPSQLVEQRPDVRQAEENMHSASALIGVAVANRLPNFGITADAGSMAVVLGHLFNPGTGFWDVGASVTQPIFDSGVLLHRERAAQAAYTAAAEQYRSTVLTAFENVADTLNALQQDANGLKAAVAAKNADEVTLDLTRKQYASGYVNYLALLNAEQSYQQAVINQVQAQASRYADTAALFQALGGGWWHRPDIPKN